MKILGIHSIHCIHEERKPWKYVEKQRSRAQVAVLSENSIHRGVHSVYTNGTCEKSLLERFPLFMSSSVFAPWSMKMELYRMISSSCLPTGRWKKGPLSTIPVSVYAVYTCIPRKGRPRESQRCRKSATKDVQYRRQWPISSDTSATIFLFSVSLL